MKGPATLSTDALAGARGCVGAEVEALSGLSEGAKAGALAACANDFLTGVFGTIAVIGRTGSVWTLHEA